MSKPAWLNAMAVSLVVSLSVYAADAWGQQQPDPREPEQKVVEAWVKAGGRFGWMTLTPRDQLGFIQSPGREDIRGFWFNDVPNNLADLPIIQVPFALGLNRANETVLKALAKQRRLKWLDLSKTAISDADLKALAGLRLQSLAIPEAVDTEIGLKHYLAAVEAPTRLRLQGWKKIGDAVMKEIGAHGTLKELRLGGTNVTDIGLKNLAALRNLEVLDLGSTNVTDAGLKNLAALRNLKVLELYRTRITDAGLKSLAPLSQLREVNLNATTITGVGLKELAGLTELRLLVLGSTAVTDDGLRELTKLPQLKSLILTETKVTDEGMKYLAGLTQLASLNISRTGVTDAGMKHLAGLGQLRSLNVRDTRVTEAGLKELAGLKLTNLIKNPLPQLGPSLSGSARCVGDACKAVGFFGGYGGGCIRLTNRGDKPVKVEFMVGGGKAIRTLLPGKDASTTSPAGCITTEQQLGTYWATYTEVAPEKKGVQGCIPTASGGCAQPSR
jgi:Leucine-rich repeat (LRR) protein